MPLAPEEVMAMALRFDAGPDSGLADSDFGRDRDETEEKVGAMEDEMERRKRQAIVNRARNTDVNESGGDRM